MANAPLLDGALAVTTGTEVTASVPHTTIATDEPRSTDEFRDQLRDLIAELDALADADMICGCDVIYTSDTDDGAVDVTDALAGHDACWTGQIGEIVTDARRRLWAAELDRGRRG